MQRAKTFKVLVLLIGIYLGLYLIDTVHGGYFMKFETEPKERFTVSGLSFLAPKTAVFWQPFYGYVASGATDFIGTTFYPLVQLDRKLWHHTMRATEPSFWDTANNLPVRRVHPKSRPQFIEEQRKFRQRIDANPSNRQPL